MSSVCLLVAVFTLLLPPGPPAHARLMLRGEVAVQDAVVAVSLMESSMQSSALVENVDALHTGFAEDPEGEYRNQGETLFAASCACSQLDNSKLAGMSKYS